MEATRMSIDANRGGTQPRISDDRLRPYVAPRLGPGQSVRELTQAITGSVGDGGGGGMMMMAGV